MNPQKKQKILIEMMEETDEILTRNKLMYFLSYGTLLGSIREHGFISWDTDIDLLIPSSEYIQVVEVLRKELIDKYDVIWIDDPSYDRIFARIRLQHENHHLLHIDLFPLVGTPSGKFQRLLFVYTNYLVHKIFYIKKLNHHERYKNNKKRYFQAVFFKIIFLIIPESILYKYLKLSFVKYKYEDSIYVYNLGGSYLLREIFNKKIFEKTVRTRFEHLKLLSPYHYQEFLEQIYGKDYMVPKRDNYLV